MPKPKHAFTPADLQRIIKKHPLVTAGIKLADVGDVIWDKLGDLAKFTMPKKAGKK